MAFPHLVTDEGLEPHNVNIVYMFFTDDADTWIDTSDTIDTKIAALREHTSQLRQPEKLEEMLRGWSAEDGKKIGTDAAEGFRLLKMER
jgi:LmbE family N-acetylglucosaminyl deacetylase